MQEYAYTQDTMVAATVTARLRQSRGAIVFLLLLVTAPYFSYLAARNIWQAQHAPDFGIRAWFGLNVATADTRWPGVLRDDDFVLVDGFAPANSVEVRDHLLTRAPGEMTITFGRGADRFTLTAASRPWPMADRIASWMRFVTCVVGFVIALGVYLARPDGKISLLFLLFNYVSSITLLLNWIGPATVWEAYGFPFVMLACATFGLHLFAMFPAESTLFARHKWLHRAIYVPPAVIAPIWAFPGIPEWLFSSANAALWIWSAICAITGNVMLVANYVKAVRGRDKLGVSRAKPMLAGAVIGYIPPVLVHASIGILNWWADSRVVYEGSIACICAFMVGTGYSLVRHNAMLVDRFTAAVLAYGASLVFLCLGFGGLTAGAWGVANLLGIAESHLVTMVITASAVLGLRPAFNLIKGRIDRLFARERLTADQTFEILQSLRTRTQQQAPRDDMLRQTLQALDPLGHQRAELWILSDDGSEIQPQIAIESEEQEEGALAVERAKSISPTGPLATTLRSGRSGGVPGLCPRELEHEAASELWRAGLALAVPVAPHGEFSGFLGLGRRKSGTSYSTDELVLAGHVGSQAAMILERSTGTRMGRYRIEKRLGVGGMAEVFLARQMGLGGFERRVALKRPLPDMAEDPKFITMFLEEARIAARLQHENIAAIYEVDKHHDHYYLTMEYVDGPSVRSLMRSCAKALVPVPVSVALTITADLLRALAHVHAYTGPDGQQLALIHRDVNPNNVLLRTDGKGKLVDFGIARAGDRLMRTQTGHVRGTIPYMSPEQARAANDIDPRTDVYSAAVVCYEMLTAIRAFPNGPHRDRPKALSAARPDAPAGLEAVVARGMAFLRDDRHATAGEFLNDLRRVTDDATVSDYPAVASLIARTASAAGEDAPALAMQTMDTTGTFS